MSVSVLLPTLRLVAHASARLDTEINPAAAILATRSEMDGSLPEYLLSPSEFMYAFPCSYHEIARETHQTAQR